MNRSVPLLPELQHGGGVPPVLVEQSVSEHGDFGEQIESAVEDGEEEKQPEQERGKRASEDAVEQIGSGVAENGVDELHHDDVHQREGDQHRHGELHDIAQTDGFGARIGQLVEQGRSHASDQAGQSNRHEVQIVAERVGDLFGGLLLQTVVCGDEGVALERHQNHAHHRHHGCKWSTVEGEGDGYGMSECQTMTATVPMYRACRTP